MPVPRDDQWGLPHKPLGEHSHEKRAPLFKNKRLKLEAEETCSGTEGESELHAGEGESA